MLLRVTSLLRPGAESVGYRTDESPTAAPGFTYHQVDAGSKPLLRPGVNALLYSFTP